jgi:hypothetical protein
MRGCSSRIDKMTDNQLSLSNMGSSLFVHNITNYAELGNKLVHKTEKQSDTKLESIY